MSLRDIGIAAPVAELLEAQGITKLYPPQEEAWAALKDGSNIVVSIPTASGKSLVAYLAILHRFLATGKKSLFIVPLRALASEKFDELKAFSSLGFRVAMATGDLDEKDPRLGTADVIVCTSEKADSLLRHRTPWVDQIGCIVSDEMHLIHDPSRGPTLEVLLSRFRALLPEAQIVGLSATIKNADELARWLDAKLIRSEWRPVDLRIGTYLPNNLAFLGQPDRQLDGAGDPIAALVEDALLAGGQCLVFVSTRRSAEAQAVKLAGVVRDLLDQETLEQLEINSAELEAGDDPSPTAKKLAKLTRAGVAYHTAGLDSKQRKFVESQFRAGNLKVLCATPTLAAGVNTPARRVIIRDMRRFEMGRGNVPLPVMEVKQMMGRAGRPRYDPYGEAVLIAKDLDMKEILEEEYLRGEPEPVSSKLAADAALRIHTLASIAGGYCESQASIEAFLQHTFWAQQTDSWIIRDRLEDTLWFLEENEFIEQDGGHVKATLFGKRTSDLYIDPLSALRMRQALQSDLPEPTTFGALHVVAGCPDLYPLYLRQSDGWVQETYYARFPELLLQDEDLDDAYSHVKTAQMLMDWMEERPQQEVESKYKVGPGDINMRRDAAGWMLHAFQELARTLRSDWQRPIAEVAMRLEHGIKAELLPLIRIKGVGRIRARTLFAAGFQTVALLKQAPLERLAKLPGFGDTLAREVLLAAGGDPGPAKAGRKTKAAAKTSKPEAQRPEAPESTAPVSSKAAPEKGKTEAAPGSPQQGLSQWGMKP